MLTSPVTDIKQPEDFQNTKDLVAIFKNRSLIKRYCPYRKIEIFFRNLMLHYETPSVYNSLFITIGYKRKSVSYKTPIHYRKWQT